MAIFLSSFLILYFELILIRYLPAHFVYLGYLTNFVLIGAFAGIGLGFLLGRVKYNLIHFFPWLFLLLITITRFFGTAIDTSTSEIIFFRGELWKPLSELGTSYFWLLFLFILIVTIFTFLTQPLGKLFAQTKRPLKAYVLDIAGSIAGIVVFYSGSYFALPAFIWMAIFGALFLLRFGTKRTAFLIMLFPLALSVFLSVTREKDTTIVWSPYSKLTLFKEPFYEIWHVFSNEVGHQYFSSKEHADFYYTIYERFSSQTDIKNALIIGAGTGQDVTAALAAGVDHIDAVEIDPKIQGFGKALHPARPYDSPRVTVTIDDGRNFLHNSKKKYDLVVFALTDSLVLAAGGGNIRLESYLFTLDSFREIRKHLTQEGQFIMYNDYREQWLINRLAYMQRQVFGERPRQVSFGSATRMLIAENSKKKEAEKISSVEVLPTDDWPFLYLKDKGIPSFYLWIMGVMFALTVAATALVWKLTGQKGSSVRRFLVFFLLGAAFSLLETKSIVQLGLLFGTTWLVSGIAFTGILCTVLIACFFVSRRWTGNFWIICGLLIASLIIQYIIPVRSLLVESIYLRFFLAMIFFFLPIFFANLIFARLFAKSESPEFDFGANLLGLVAGGIVEYLSLISGYSSLVLVAAGFYLLAIVLGRTKMLNA